MQIRRMTLRIEEVAVSPRVINAIQLPLPHKQIGLTQRPSLCHGQAVELITDFDELVVYILESFIDLAFSVGWSVGLQRDTKRNKHIPLLNDFGELETPVQ